MFVGRLCSAESRSDITLHVEERNELVGDVAGLPSELVDEDQEAKQFDLLMLRLQLRGRCRRRI
jgi:type I restriction enzyme, R subunit